MSTGSPAPDTPDAGLDRLLRRAARAPVTYPPGLVARSLATVRELRGRMSDTRFELSTPRGALRIARPAVITIVHRLGTELCVQLGGLHVRTVDADSDGIHVDVEIRYGTSADTVAELRDHLAAALVDHLGTEVPPVSVHVSDVHG